MFERFRGTRTPSTDFAAVRSDMQSTPLFVDVELATARSLAAGTALELPLNGNVIYVDQKALSGFAQLHFNDDALRGNTPFTVFPGFVARVPFTKLLLENQSQPGMVMRLIYGVDIDFTPAVSAGVFGEVSVVNGERARTMGGAAFWGRAVVGAVAAQYTHAQLWNLPASGKNVIVEQIRSSTTALGALTLCRMNVVMGTLDGVPVSKFVGGAASAATQMRTMNNAVLSTGDGQLATSRAPADTEWILNMTEPIIVPPGQGLHIALLTVNLALYTIWEFYEEGI